MPIFIDFLSKQLEYRRQYGGGNKQAIAKAIGINKFTHPIQIIDATAGMGTDAFILATLGCHVTLIERSNIIATSLKSAIQTAYENGTINHILQRMQLIHADAIEYLNNINISNIAPRPDVIYCDPMFPAKKKNSLNKQAMRTLRSIVGDDLDSNHLVDIALKTAKHRVVIKLPRYSNSIANITPTFQIYGKANRFDVYCLTQTHGM